jgi:hypothetical protein
MYFNCAGLELQSLGRYTVWQNVASYRHGGWLPGVRTWICHRTDGIDIVAFYNGENSLPDLNAIANSLLAAGWPAHELFSEILNYTQRRVDLQGL